VENNPVLEYCKILIFDTIGEILIERDPKWGVPNTLYNQYQKLEADFVKGDIHPSDLKKAVST